MNQLNSQDHKHFKMYKSNKQWLFAGIVAFGMTAFVTVDQAKADSTETTTTGTVTAATDNVTTGNATAATDNTTTGTTEIITPENPKDGVETSKTVTRTIIYMATNNKEVAQRVTQTAHFTRSVTIDSTTGKEISATDWQSTDATFDAVTSPSVGEWICMTPEVASETVTADTADQVETVRYITSTDSRYDFTFYDADDNNKVLYHWDMLITPVDPDFQNKFSFLVDDLEAKGFDFEKAGYVEDYSRRSTVNSSSVVNGRTINKDTSVWYFNHGTQTVTPENPKDGV